MATLPSQSIRKLRANALHRGLTERQYIIELIDADDASEQAKKQTTNLPLAETSSAPLRDSGDEYRNLCRHKVSPERIQRILYLYGCGFTSAQIAERLSVPVGTVTRLLWKHKQHEHTEYQRHTQRGSPPVLETTFRKEKAVKNAE